MPGSGMLTKLSKALGVRAEYFFLPVKTELGEVEYRERLSMPGNMLIWLKKFYTKERKAPVKPPRL